MYIFVQVIQNQWSLQAASRAPLSCSKISSWDCKERKWNVRLGSLLWNYKLMPLSQSLLYRCGFVSPSSRHHSPSLPAQFSSSQDSWQHGHPQCSAQSTESSQHLAHHVKLQDWATSITFGSCWQSTNCRGVNNQNLKLPSLVQRAQREVLFKASNV